MDASKKQREPVAFKSLAELKRFIRPGVKLKTVSHANHADMVGLTRVVTTVQTVGFYSSFFSALFCSASLRYKTMQPLQQQRQCQQVGAAAGTDTVGDELLVQRGGQRDTLRRRGFQNGSGTAMHHGGRVGTAPVVDVGILHMRHEPQQHGQRVVVRQQRSRTLRRGKPGQRLRPCAADPVLLKHLNAVGLPGRLQLLRQTANRLKKISAGTQAASGCGQQQREGV